MVSGQRQAQPAHALQGPLGCSVRSALPARRPGSPPVGGGLGPFPADARKGPTYQKMRGPKHGGASILAEAVTRLLLAVLVFPFGAGRGGGRPLAGDLLHRRRGRRVHAARDAGRRVGAHRRRLRPARGARPGPRDGGDARRRGRPARLLRRHSSPQRPRRRPARAGRPGAALARSWTTANRSAPTGWPTTRSAPIAPVRDAHTAPEVKPGDRLPLTGVRADVVSAGGELIETPLAGGGQATPGCDRAEDHIEDGTENYRSVGLMFEHGAFRFLALGDLSGNTLTRIVCPDQSAGAGVGLSRRASRRLRLQRARRSTRALRPRVAVLNNGPAEGRIARRLPHAARARRASRISGSCTRRASPATPATTSSPISTTPPTATGSTCGAQDDGSFTLTNGRNGFTKAYARPPPAAGRVEERHMTRGRGADRSARGGGAGSGRGLGASPPCGAQAPRPHGRARRRRRAPRGVRALLRVVPYRGAEDARHRAGGARDARSRRTSARTPSSGSAWC